MAGTVATDITVFTGATGGSTSACDATTDWVTAPTLDTETFVQGTGSMSAKVSKTTYTSVFSVSGTVDLSGKCIYVWMLCLTPAILGTKAAGGMRIRVADALANYKEWYVGGNDTYKGGWECFIVHTGETASAVSATPPVMTAITKVGVVWYTTASSAKTNCYWDAMRYGTGLSITAGTEGSPGTFADFLSYETTNVIGVASLYNGIVLVQGKLTFGSTTSGTATYFKDTTSPIVVFKDTLTPADWYTVTCQGNTGAETTIQWGDVVGSGTGMIGNSGITFKSADSANAMLLACNTANITNLKLYACKFDTTSTIGFGTNSIELNGTTHLVDNVFAKTGQITKNIGGTNVLLRNIVSNNTNTTSAIKSYDTAEDGDSFQLISGRGWSTGLTSSTITVNDYDSLNATNDVIIVDSDSNTWKFIDSSQNPLTVAWSAAGTSELQLLYSLNITCTTAAGVAISGAQTMLHESSQDAIVNLQGTNASGYSTDSVLVRQDSDNSTNFTRGPFTLAIYKYGYDPLRSATTVASQLNLSTPLTVDPAVSLTEVQALAVSGTSVTYETNFASIIEYSGGTGTLTAGETLTGGSSGATGVVVELIEGTQAAGKMLLKTRNGTSFSSTESLTSSSWSGNKTSTTVQNFKWYIDCGNNPLASVYQWLTAKMAMTSPDSWVTSARKRFTKLLYYEGGEYNTKRNSTYTEGVVLGNKGAGVVSYMTDNAGNTYVPPVSYTITFEGLQADTEVRIYKDSDDSELAGIENSGTSWGYTYIYTSDIPVYVRVAHVNYEWLTYEDLVLSNADQTIPVQQRFDRNYST